MPGMKSDKERKKKPVQEAGEQQQHKAKRRKVKQASDAPQPAAKPAPEEQPHEEEQEEEPTGWEELERVEPKQPKDAGM